MEKIKKIPQKKLIEAYNLMQIVKGWSMVKFDICAGKHFGHEICLSGYNFTNDEITDSFIQGSNSIDEAIAKLKELQE